MLQRQGTIRAYQYQSYSIYSGITISTVKNAARRHRASPCKDQSSGRPISEGSEGRSVRRRRAQGAAAFAGEATKGESVHCRTPATHTPHHHASCMHACMHAPSGGPDRTAGWMGNSTSSSRRRPQEGWLVVRRLLVRGVRPSRIRPRHFFVLPSTSTVAVSQSSSQGFLLLLRPATASATPPPHQGRAACTAKGLAHDRGNGGWNSETACSEFQFPGTSSMLRW